MRQSTSSDAGDCLKIGGVASAAIMDLLTGPVRPAELIGLYPVAVYLRTSGGVVALISSLAVRLPNAMVLARADHAGIGRQATDGPILVGGGGVQVGPVCITVGRWRDPVPRLGRVDPDLLAGRLEVVRAALPAWPDATDLAARRLRTGRDALAALLAGAADLADTVRSLVGLGAGLTPAGDDLLAGAMAGLVVFGAALDRPDVRSLGLYLGREVAGHAAATTPLAADLAQHAARGALIQPAAELCLALADERPDAGGAVRTAIDRLLRVGHTSGRDLAEGLVMGASAGLRRSSGRDSPDSRT